MPPRPRRAARGSKNLAEKIAAVGERRTRCQDMLAELERTGEDQISLTDPDSRAMAAHTHVAVGYNVQIAVDVKHKLIVEQQVTNQVLDMGLLTQTAAPANDKIVNCQLLRFRNHRVSKLVTLVRRSAEVSGAKWPAPPLPEQRYPERRLRYLVVSPCASCAR